jgi:hypothetical protein
MYVEPIEIYSDRTNAAILRHPGRRFPGVLIQGDTLYTLCRRLDKICREARSHVDPETYEECNDLRDQMREYLNHYKTVLYEHGLPLPFNEIPSV